MMYGVVTSVMCNLCVYVCVCVRVCVCVCWWTQVRCFFMVDKNAHLIKEVVTDSQVLCKLFCFLVWGIHVKRGLSCQVGLLQSLMQKQHVHMHTPRNIIQSICFLNKVYHTYVRKIENTRVITYRASYYSTSPSINLQTL